MTQIVKHLLLIAALGVVGGAHAQNAKPAAEKFTTNKMMTRDELRACMKLQDDIKATVTSIDQRKAALQEEKARIAPANEAVQARKAELDKQLATAKEADVESAAHSKRVEAWNAEMKEAQESTMRTAERRVKQLQDERADMDRKAKALQVEREKRIASYKTAVDAFNQSAKEAQDMAQEWNKRNDALADEADKVIDMRATYAADCGKRKFLEADEQAIKNGK